ncbi:exodeoxyribonuclease VII large subunit [Candidatus Riflebacteria bacterium]
MQSSYNPIPAYLTLSQLGRLIKANLNELFHPGVWVVGEISRISVKTGHWYLELVEKEPGQNLPGASINAVIWRSQAERILTTLGFQLKAGLKILCYVRLDFYAPYGRISAHIQKINREFFLGELALAKEKNFLALKKMGCLGRNNAISCPQIPLRIGLIASNSSEGYKDFIGELEKSRFPFRVKFYDALMQGLKCPESIIRGLKLLSVHEDDPPDLIFIVRGGGSKVDLAPFNDLQMNKAISFCPVPVICGVGHEGDHHLADDFSSHSFKTPTAAAAFLVETVSIIKVELDSYQKELSQPFFSRYHLLFNDIRQKNNRLRDYAKLIRVKGEEIAFWQKIWHEKDWQEKLKNKYFEKLERIVASLENQTITNISRKGLRLNGYYQTWSRIFPRRREQFRSGLGYFKSHIFNRAVFSILLKQKAGKLCNNFKDLSTLVGNNIKIRGKTLQWIKNSIKNVWPKRILKRGFTLIKQEGNYVKSKKIFNSAKEFDIHFHDGPIRVPARTHKCFTEDRGDVNDAERKK